jgi:sec-independent protein translocase protein TatC
MYIISLTGLIGARFWLKNFRYALIAIVIFGAVITPDGSGLTMWFISIPMLLLYLLGILVIKANIPKDRAAV